MRAILLRLPDSGDPARAVKLMPRALLPEGIRSDASPDTATYRMQVMNAILPKVEALMRHSPERTIFIRFVPPQTAEEMSGTSRRYYQKWSDVTLGKSGPNVIRLLPDLERYVPPAKILDKRVYLPWTDGALDRVLDAVDRGYRVILATDGTCSSADRTHDALIGLYRDRFAEQVEAVPTDVILDGWP